MDKKIKEIKEALAAATPGPWEWRSGGYNENGSFYGDTSFEICSFGGQKGYEEHAGTDPKDEDINLIANAPSYIDYLLQQIEIKDKALEFYEDETNYTTEILVPGEEYSFLLILDDKGKVARAALKGDDTNE
ncbi:hypothetical protein A9P44_00470 [Paenibacillus polymyxa]|nr:hypothetical protein [Paenibacillus polymyxa]OBA07861.1 hypothetical protein A9P44_00470 [Paenibacillus polymyxa]